MVRIRTLAITASLAALAASTVIGGSALARSGRDPQTAAVRANLPYSVSAALLPNSKENTNVIVQNNGTAPATIAMDIYTPAGVPVPGAGKQEFSVPVGGTRTFVQALNTGLLPGFRGVGVVSSDQPINALLVRDMVEATTERHAYSVHNSFGTGSNKVTLPFIANNNDNIYQTRFAIANTGSAVACVSIAYAFDVVVSGGGGTTDTNGPGGSGCTVGTYAIPANGQIAFGPLAVPTESILAMPALTVGKLMAATITSTGAPVTAAVDAYRLRNGRFQIASYDGFNYTDAASTTDDLGTTIIVPIALKISGFYSQILMSNPNATATTATITYTPQGGGATIVIAKSIPANGTANHSAYETPGLPEGFVGSATIVSANPIAAVLFRSELNPATLDDRDTYTAVSAIPTDRAATSAKLPLVFRRAFSTPGCADQTGTCGYNTWVNVTVPGGGSANITLTTVADTTTPAPGCGAAATYTATFTVVGSQVFYQNLVNSPGAPNGLGANPACLWGGMVITSNVPIVVVADVTSDQSVGDNDGLYNGFTN